MTSEHEHLLRHGNLRVPCSRYGSDTEDCAPIAIAVTDILARETGVPATVDDLDYAMGLVVNDHDDVAYLLVNYGREAGYPPEDYLDNETIARAIVHTVTEGRY